MSNGLTHIFEHKVLKSNINKKISTTDNINFTISASTDDTYYNFYESFLTLELKIKAAGEFAGAKYIRTKHQPAGLITNSQCTYVYLKNGELVTVQMNSENEYLGANRSVVSQVFMPERLHKIARGYTEFDYETKLQGSSNSNEDSVFFSCLPITSIDSTNSNCTAVMNIPLRDVCEGMNVNSFINLKSLDVSLKTLDYGDFFETGSNKAFITGVGSNGVPTVLKGTISSVEITKISITNHCWRGTSGELDDSLTTLSNTTIRCLNYSISGLTNFVENPIIPFAAKYLLLFVTTDNDFTQYSNLPFDYCKVSIFGGGSNISTSFDNTNGTDPKYFDMLNYCANIGRELSLISYESWKNKFHIVCLPVGELFSQKGNNVFNVDLKFKTTAPTGSVLRMIFIKDTEGSDLE